MKNMKNSEYLLFENKKVKAELEFDLLLESSEFDSSSQSDKQLFREAYEMGMNTGRSLFIGNEKTEALLNEGIWDRFKAGAAGAYQGAKNVSGFGGGAGGDPLAKDIAIKSRLSAFKKKIEPILTPDNQGETDPKASSPTDSNPKTDPQPAANDIAKIIAPKLEQDLDTLSKKDEQKPAPTPQEVENLKQQAKSLIDNDRNIPKDQKQSLWQKTATAINANPNKARFMVSAIPYIAGLAMAVPTAGLSIPVAYAIGAATQAIGNSMIFKAENPKASVKDVLKTGLLGALSGTGKVSLGGAIGRGLAGLSSRLGAMSVTPSTIQAHAVTGVPATPDGTFDQNKIQYPSDDGTTPDGTFDQNKIQYPSDDGTTPDGTFDQNKIQYPNQSQPTNVGVRPPTAIGGSRYDDLIKMGYDPNQIQTNSAGYSSPVQGAAPVNPSTLSAEDLWRRKNIGTKGYGAGILNKAWLKETSLFVKGENNNQFKLRKSLNEALSADAKKLLDDVIGDLMRSLNARDLTDLLTKLNNNKQHYQEELDFLLKVLGQANMLPAGFTSGNVDTTQTDPASPAPPAPSAAASVPDNKPGQQDVNLTGPNITVVKSFLSRLIELQGKLKTVNPNNKDSLKDLLMFNLGFSELTKNPKVTKTNKTIDTALQSSGDILGEINSNNAKIIKNINALKSHSLFTTPLVTRLQPLLSIKNIPNDKNRSFEVLKLKKFLYNLFNVVTQTSGKFKQKVGDSNAVKKELSEAFADIQKVEADRQLILKQLNEIVPIIILLTVELKQYLNPKNPANKPVTPKGFVPKLVGRSP